MGYKINAINNAKLSGIRMLLATTITTKSPIMKVNAKNNFERITAYVGEISVVI